MDQQVITKPQLSAVMLKWEQDARAGLCRPAEEQAALPAERVAQENTDNLWRALQSTAA